MLHLHYPEDNNDSSQESYSLRKVINSFQLIPIYHQ